MKTPFVKKIVMKEIDPWTNHRITTYTLFGMVVFRGKVIFTQAGRKK